jgi:hypothetical protein
MHFPGGVPLLTLAASLALSGAIWQWFPAWVTIYRAVIMVLAGLSIVALWSADLRRWVRRRSK